MGMRNFGKKDKMDERNKEKMKERKERNRAYYVTEL